MLRAFFLFALVTALFAVTGCDGQNQTQATQTETPGGSRGISLYPLSTPPPPPAQPIQSGQVQYSTPAPGYVTPYGAMTYQTSPVPPAYTATTYPAASVSAPGYCTPTYCPPPETQSYTPTTLVIPDPPVVIDNVYYPSTTGVTTYGGGASYTSTTTYSTGTYAAPAASPYAGLSTYSATPTYSSTYTASSYTATTAPQVTTYPSTTTTTYTTTYPAPGPVTTTYPAPDPVTTTYTTTTPTYSSPPLVPTYGSPETVAAMTSPLTPAVGGYQLVPAPDIPPRSHPNDAGPSQWFEILRPGNGPIRIGRVSSTCVCVGVRVPNRHIAAGERALIEARTLTRPPARNLTYGIYVNVEEPEKTVLDADVTLP